MAVATRTFQNLIGGQWVDGSSGETFDTVSPATGELLGTFPKSTRDDVDRAVAAAREAFRSWSLMPAPRRGEILFRAAEILVERKEDLAQEMTREMGKVLAEARGDVQEAIDMVYFMAGEGRRLVGETVPAEMPDKFAMSVRMPVGVIACITPWNFPIAIPSWKIAPALIAGNTVVFKPASDTPLLALRLAEILQEAGLPDGVLNMVFGGGSDVGDAVATHPDVDVVSFTGSSWTGREITKRTADQLKKVTLELGGKNVIVVLNDANLDLAIDGIVWSAFGTTGQRCTAASRVVVEEGVYDEVVERLAERARGLTLGNGLEDSVEVGPVINDAALQKIHSYREVGEADGARLVAGGNIATGAGLEGGHFYEPTVWADVDPNARIAQEEIFGPVTAVIKARDFDHAIEIANGVDFGLSSAIFTENVNRAFVAMRDLYTGICYINAGTIGAEIQLPFGGTRDTGNGHRDAGVACLDNFTEWKSVYVDYSGTLQRAQIDHD